MLGNFETAFRWSASFYLIIAGNFNVFNTVTLKQVFWKTNIFQKSGVQLFLLREHHDWKSNISLQNCTSTASVKTNRMGSAKGSYHKGRSFATNYFSFWKLNVNRTFYSWFNVPITQIAISIIFVSVWVLFQGMFSLWVSLIKG